MLQISSLTLRFYVWNTRHSICLLAVAIENRRKKEQFSPNVLSDTVWFNLFPVLFRPYNPGWPGNFYVVQVGLDLTQIHLRSARISSPCLVLLLPNLLAVVRLDVRSRFLLCLVMEV